MLEPLTPRELEVLRMIGRGMSNRAIANELVISLSTVRWYLRQIYSKLDVHNRTEAVLKASKRDLLDEVVGQAELQPISARTNIPLSPLPLLGREEELVEIKEWLTTSRLVTLTGFAGVGKTRLAIEVAMQLIDRYESIYFVDLAPVSEVNFVADTIASVLRITEAKNQTALEQLKQYLHNRHVLLVLDNFEHLIPAAALVSTLLSGVADVSILVTSREALRVYGEQEYFVRPLLMPENWIQKDAKALSEYSATALFIQRAQAAKRDFEVDDETAPIIAEICWRLDGLPLAIELAAARIKLFPSRMLLERLKSRLGTLTAGVRDAPQRHQTLRDALDWSFFLLSEDQKRLFLRLAVFAGGGSLEALQDICQMDLELDVLDGLDSLVQKSLLKVMEAGSAQSPRFTMLETIREYTYEKLKRSDEASAFYERHAKWYVNLAEKAASELRGFGQNPWMDKLAAEEDNFHAILNRCRDGSLDPENGLRLVAGLQQYWHVKGAFREADTWLNQMLALAPKAAPELRAKVLCSAGKFAYHRGDFAQVSILCQEALAIARQIDDKQTTAEALHFLAHAAQDQGDYDQGEAMLAQSLAVFREINDLQGTAQALNCLGDSCRFGRDYQRGRALLEEAISIYRQLQHVRGITVGLINLGMILQRLEENTLAAQYLFEAFALGVQLQNEFLLGGVAIGLAGLSAAEENPERAALLIGIGEAMQQRAGTSVPPSDRIDYDIYVTATRNQLKESVFEETRRDGFSMTSNDAIDYIRKEIMNQG